MDIDGNVQLHSRRQQTIVARVIEEAAFGRAVDERTDETKVPNCTNEPGNCGIRAPHWQHSKSRETFGVTGDSCRQMVVHRPRYPDKEPGTRSGPGPLLESTCIVMPASSIDCRRRSPISGRSSIALGPLAGDFLDRKPRRLIAFGSKR